ncbi:aldehyde dehydrogenase family protein [Pseudoclavibacter chungangensis]|uniref:Aldehyde dehydrogenase family protein n=1 Tax=Pseudoclavibacter chungangensis TaxID=587635 RepID=A0A7J5BSH5_9MICO|nr:aldehyde dehydrogenase family protein [Pseudoclavibacter chungangensis]KAB1655684.1 aldehyde dehydrogenase family protein [Pseudoclavibacter chungangensis]NYJ67903.1 aldehyde dehydrogenase (NAD+)/gamma-glutamyl-gamma-aminobutyraldehyde dehydrogenase [Pseudoclavibacter chungangensis]
MTDTTWTERAALLHPDGRLLIDGHRRDAADGGTTASVNPATASEFARIATGTTADVDEAVTIARASFERGEWSRIGAAERGAVLTAWAALVDAHAEELALLETLDMGKPIRESRTIDAPGAAATIRWYGELCDKLADEVPATPAGSTAIVSRAPLGVVAAIVPWNYPMEIATWKIAPALAAGNSVVLKPAMESSLSALRLAELAFEAGLPTGALQVVTGSGRVVGDRLARHADVDCLTFTGSTAVAKGLLVAAGESNMKRLSLEAGGKSANLVFADVDDLELAARKAAFGAYYNQGEVCSANSRIYVERAVFDDFLAAFESAARDYLPGDPLDETSGTGALVNAAHADAIERAVTTRGAGRIAFGGERPSIGGSDAFYTPTAVTGIDDDHPLVVEELFGPVAVVLPFDGEDEAIARANDTRYGLAASVWTGSLARAHRVSSRLVAGTVSVNTVDALGLTTPFGGFRESGFGRDLSAHALDNYVGLKTTWFQHG